MTNAARYSIKILFSAVRGFIRNGAALIAGHLAFMMLLTLFPFMIFLVALAGFAGNTEAGTMIVAFVFENMPEHVAAVFEEPILQVLQEVRGGLLTIGMAGALWTAASAIEGARAGVEWAFGEDARIPFWRRRLESIALTIVGAALLVAGSFALILAPVIWHDSAAAMGLGDLPALELGPLRTLIGVAAIYAVIAALYAMLPVRRPPWRAVLPGAVLTLVLWGASAAGFSSYLSHFNTYDVTYGSLGGVVIAMIFFYLLGMVFLLGAELNAAIARTARADKNS